MIYPGQDGDASDFTIVAEAGEDLSARDAVYISSSDGKAYKCDADDLTKIGFAGFVIVSATTGNDVYILTWGIMNGFTGLTVNAVYYLSGTAGAITATKPTNYKVVAKAMTTTTIRIVTEPTTRVRVYTANDTWTKPAGLIKIKVQVQAAGGGSGSCDNGTTASGASGAYTEGEIYANDLSATETVTVGAGGPGGAPNNTGTTGGTSSFGSHLVCTGGVGSGHNSTSRPAGGTATTPGHFSMNGVPGTVPFSDSGGTNKRIFPCSAPSYMSVMAETYTASFTDSRVSSLTPTGYGWGGASHVVDSEPSGYTGNTGGNGIIIVTEYY